MSLLSDIKSSLNSLGSNIENIGKQIPIQDKLSNFMGYINDTETYIHQNLFTLEEYDSYRWVPPALSPPRAGKLGGETCSRTGEKSDLITGIMLWEKIVQRTRNLVCVNPS